MSAWVVSKKHIDALVTLARRGPAEGDRDGFRFPLGYWRADHGPENGDWFENVVGQMLVDECVKSVSYRYPHDDVEKGELPGPRDAYYTRPYHFEPYQPGLTAVEGLKAISCLSYQSCEHPEWEQSEAFAFCQSLKNALIHCLPGYDEAPWGID